MKTVKILLNSMDYVKRFVNDMGRVGGMVTIRSERRTVDAKSMMGIFTLDLTKPLYLRN